jgi:methyl-accepting chemotaxis protein
MKKNNLKVTRNKFINKKVLIACVFILLSILFIFSARQGYSNLKSSIKNYQMNSFEIIEERMFSVLTEINIFPRSAGNDILFLSKLFSLKNIINGEENHVDELADLRSNFLTFLEQNIAYYHLRYINEFGNEIVRVDFDGENQYIVLENELQNKKHREYFQETAKLNSGEVYISKLDLNVENDELENRGTEENPIYVPVIRYATPLFNNNGERKGLIISNIYADYFLDDIKRSQREGEIIFLIDNQGDYLAHPDKEKEFAFMFDEKEDNFYSDYPEIKEGFLLNLSAKRFESDNSIFTFEYFHPTSTNFEVYEGSKKVFGETPEEKYYWILVSVSKKEIISEISDDLKSGYLFSLLFYGLIILIIFCLIIGMNFKEKKIGRRKK